MRRSLLPTSAALACAALAACSDITTSGPSRASDDPARSTGATTITWSGRTWNVKSGDGLGPGPNNWSAGNVWVDANGYLHLRISRDPATGKWYSAEIASAQNLGFGTYQFWVEGRIDQLDPNVILGLFGYAGPDGTNEIDIEFGRFGDPLRANSTYSVYPAVAGYPETSHLFPLALEGTFTTQRYRWLSGSVHFQTLGGHRSDNLNQIQSWTFTPSDPLQRIPQQAMPARINLWLFRGQPPTNATGVEIVIRRFTFTPA